jgi:hypothetical protein
LAVVPQELSGYLNEAVRRLRRVLGDELVGAYAGGSVCLGAYEHGRSDVDLAAVSREAVPRELKGRLVGALRHEALPCPTRGLELVLYPEATVRQPAADPGYELELNTGSGLPYLCALDPAERPEQLGAHWYVIDRSILAARGLALDGPPAGDVFAPVPRELVLPALAESLRWFSVDQAAPGDDAVLNACRALRYAAEGVWSAKPDAGRWAVGRLGADELIGAALRARETGEAPDAAEVAAFLAQVSVLE